MKLTGKFKITAAERDQRIAPDSLQRTTPHYWARSATAASGFSTSMPSRIG